MAENTKGQIVSFRDEYGFLSNFHECTIKDYEGNVFSSAEAMFQSYKTTDPELRKKFAEMKPGTAKKEGKKVKLREDWEDVKYDIMYYVVFQKFMQNDLLTKKLVETAGLDLIEGNTWHDKCWGMCLEKVPVDGTDVETWVGNNWLGSILMTIRSILIDDRFNVWTERDVPYDDEKCSDFFPCRRDMSIGSTMNWLLRRRPCHEYLELRNKIVHALQTKTKND